MVKKCMVIKNLLDAAAVVIFMAWLGKEDKQRCFQG